MNIFRNARRNKIKIPYKKLLILTFTLIMTTFAWFAYSRTLKTGLNMHINTWNIEFYYNDSIVNSETTIGFDDLYPTMPNQTKTIKIKNNGEVDADIEYKIESINILGTTYVISNSETEDGLYIIPGEITDIGAEETREEQKIIDDISRFPFELKINSDKVVKSSEEATLDIIFSWDGTNENYYEQDTQWGYDMAKYEDGAAISFNIKIDVTQTI